MRRRQLLKTLSLAGLGLSVSTGRQFAADAKTAREIAVFTRFLEHLPADALGEAIAQLGVAGLEAPLRPGGHIEPDDLAEQLPAFAAELARHDLRVVIAASGINRADAAAEAQLRAAAAAGIRQYRMGYLHYDLSRPFKPQIADFTARLNDLAALNREIGIQGLYQNHRGRRFVGGPVWDIVGMLEDIDPADIGVAFDFAHATVEGQNAWEMHFHRALPHIGAVYFKDYRYQNGNWQACPLGRGAVDPRSAKLVDELLPATVPISLHVEYVRGGDDIAETLPAAMRENLATLHSWFEAE